MQQRSYFTLLAPLFCSFAAVGLAAGPSSDHFRFEEVRNEAGISTDDVVTVTRVTLTNSNITALLKHRPDHYALIIERDTREGRDGRSVTLYIVRHRLLGLDWTENHKGFVDIDTKTLTMPVDHQAIAYR